MTEALIWRAAGQTVSGRPAILTIDGLSNAGKTTLAGRIGQAVRGLAVVDTDFIA